MPVRFALTALMFAAVNVALVAQQALVGRAVHEAGTGRLVSATAAGGLDYGRARSRRRACAVRSAWCSRTMCRSAAPSSTISASPARTPPMPS